MKKDFLGRVMVGLFTLSIATAGAVFAMVVGPKPMASCGGACNPGNGCPGTPALCACQYVNGGHTCVRT